MALPDRFQMQFKDDPKLVAKYMRVARIPAFFSKRRFLLTATVFVQTLLMGFGFMFVTVAVVNLLEIGEAYRGVVIPSSLLLFAAGLWLSRYALREEASDSLLNRSAVTFTADATGIRFQSVHHEWNVTWHAVDAIFPIREATVFRMAGICAGVPASAMPEGLEKREFERICQAWRDAAQ